MGSFADRGGWWVAAQGLLLVASATAWAFWGGGWGVVAVAAGLALTVAGAVLAGSGMVTLGRNLSPYPAPVPHAALVERGPYRLVRHPIYGGVILGTAGLSLTDGNWPGLVLASGLAALFWGKSRFEERKLQASVPGYTAYRRRVRRLFIPGLV